jgi:polyribonucleotide nucleotidyltransferase
MLNFVYMEARMLLNISEERVEKVTDVVSEGDIVKVKVIGFDKGKVKLSIKDAEI